MSKTAYRKWLFNKTFSTHYDKIIKNLKNDNEKNSFVIHSNTIYAN